MRSRQSIQTPSSSIPEGSDCAIAAKCVVMIIIQVITLTVIHLFISLP